MHYLVTGHTGFKGSWLSLMLSLKGHQVSGISLNPVKNSLFEKAGLKEIFAHDLRIDIRDTKSLNQAVAKIQPEVIVHLAAQPLVRESYLKPLETFEINLMGTLNVLEASNLAENLLATLIVTTDKVYKNKNKLTGYTETDELGGWDPYSTSKAAADLATQSWVKCFGNTPVAIARSGNVIGGGDSANDRIIPDLVRAISKNQKAVIRYPDAVRPWQHVLDCLNGYTSLIEQMISLGVGGEWNFGPNPSEKHSVVELIEKFTDKCGLKNPIWIRDSTQQPHEANHLLLDSKKARNELDWRDYLDFEMAVEWTANWITNKESDIEKMINQINLFLKLKNTKGTV
jgi:CDP-glucose 4,6-dehydratase